MSKLDELNAALLESIDKQQQYFKAGIEAPFIHDLIQGRIHFLMWWYKK